MPLAPAHPAAVLPLQRLGLPLSALVLGAVAPDAPVYLPVGVDYATTHSGWGIPVDAVIGAVLLWLWVAVVRDAVVDMTPYLRRRLPAHARRTRRAWLWVPVATAIGAATHVLWDSATHDWGFLVHEYAFLRHDVGPVPLHRLLQHVSTVVGSAVVAAYGVRRLSRRSVVQGSPTVEHGALWLALVPTAVLAVGITLRDPEAAVGAGLVALLVVSLAWQVLRRAE